ncbi:hypothetical protein A3Q56_05110, partial [Intoshia linei]
MMQEGHIVTNWYNVEPEKSYFWMKV